MALVGGFITIHRKIMDWEWYKDTNTFCLFIYLLLSANYEPKRFKGKLIDRGQLVTSLTSISTDTGLSIQQTRTALEHLISTGEVTNKSFTKYRVITIVNYDRYQSEQQTNQQTNNKQTTDDSTNNQQTNQQTNQQQWNNNNNINNNTIPLSRNSVRETFKPPTVEDVECYCDEKGIYGFDAAYFIDYYTMRGWKIGKNQIKDWKACIRTWLRNDERRKREKEQEYDPLPY